MITSPCDKLAMPCVHKLLHFFSNIEGNHILTGQHTQSIPMEEVSYIQKITGKQPAVCGFELLAYSPNIRRNTASAECLKEVDEAYDTIQCALDWASKGGIITYTWHWFSPLNGCDKSFFSSQTDFDARKALIKDSEENIAMLHDLDVIADLLYQFQEKNIPILWRPFHESEGDWFWWNSKGPEVAKKLYQFMFHYYTEIKHLHNLIWVWNSPLVEGYVGDEYCDIISRDLYPQPHTHTDLSKEYYELHKITQIDKGCAIAELGVIPGIDQLCKSHIPWLWYMTWSHEFCMSDDYTDNNELKALYNHPYALTLESLVDYDI